MHPKRCACVGFRARGLRGRSVRYSILLSCLTAVFLLPAWVGAHSDGNGAGPIGPAPFVFPFWQER